MLFHSNETECRKWEVLGWTPSKGDLSINNHQVTTLSMAFKKIHEEYFGISKWNKCISQSEATGLQIWVNSPKIYLMGLKSSESN